MSEELKVYCDGGARGNPGPAAGAFVVERNSRVIYKGSRYIGKATNNQAEYLAVLMAITWLSENLKESSKIYFILDSQLVARQLSGEFKIKNETLRSLFLSIKEIEKIISAKVFYSSVPRNKNRLADLLVNKTLDENS